MLKIAPLVTLLGLLAVTPGTLGATETAGGAPVAIVSALSGSAAVTAATGAEPVPARLFDWLGAGATIAVEADSDVTLAFADGRRYRLGELSVATVSAAGPEGVSGELEVLEPFPPWTELVAAADPAIGLRAGAIRLRGPSVRGLYPDGAASLPDATVLRFEPLDEEAEYRIEIRDSSGSRSLELRQVVPPVTVPAGLLKPGGRYRWAVTATTRGGRIARGEGVFATPTAEQLERREALREALRERGDAEALALLAALDERLGLLAEARDGYRAALESRPGDEALHEAVDRLDLRIGGAAADPVERPAAEPAEPADVGELVIDIHAHVLNAWDLPMVPFLKKNRPVLSLFGGLLTRSLRRRAPRHRGGGTGDEFGSCLVDLRDSSLPLADCSEEEAERLFQKLVAEDPEIRSEVHRPRSRGGEEQINWSRQGPRMIRFVSAFHRSRTQQARALISLYPEVDLFVPAMVDMDGWPGEDVELLPLAERLAALGTAMDTLNRERPGILHPYVAFNPAHGVPGSSEHVPGYRTLILRALNQDGFLGVKLYPSFGYFPIDNASLPAGSEVRPPDAEALDAELEWLYGYAERNGIPLMAHCSAKGAELGKRHSEIYGHPLNWQPVLERYPELRVSLGHFGKASTLLGKPRSEASWPVLISGLIGRYPNLYADLSLDGVPAPRRFERVLGELRELLDLQPRLRRRLMYGTDWFMLLLNRGSTEYYQRYDAHFTDELLGAGTRRAFFGGNAVEFLGLDDPRARERLRRYYAARDLRPPRWLDDVPPLPSRR